MSSEGPSSGTRSKRLNVNIPEADVWSAIGLSPAQQGRIADMGIAKHVLDRVKNAVLSEIGEVPLSSERPKTTVEPKPSELTRREIWSMYQFPDKAGAFVHAPYYLCHRGPPEARPHIPLELMNENFMQFFRNMTGALEEKDMKIALTLRELLSNGFDNEGDMKGRLNDLLSEYLGESVDPLGVGFGGNFFTDGTLGVKLMLEYKAEIGSAGDPHFQGLEYMRCQYRKLSSLRPNRVPYGLLLSVVCPYLQVTGVYMDVSQNQVLSQPFSDFMACYGEEYRVQEEVARVLRAVRLFVEQYVPWEGPISAVPWPLQGRNEVKELRSRGGAQRRLYTFMNASGTLKVGKFVRTYSIEAHQAWHECKLAPAAEILELGAGWSLVEMPYLDIESGWRVAYEVVSEKKADAAFISHMSALLLSTLAKGHGTGYVHGDYRLNNILLKWNEDEKTYEVQVIDFDWAGKTSEGTYPAILNYEKVTWHPVAGYGKRIEKEHDMWFAKQVLEQVQPS